MMKLKRPKVIRKKLEIDLFKLEKRIQKLAAQAYQIRQMLADLDAVDVTEQAAIPKGPNDVVTQEEFNHAVYNKGSEGEVRGWTADPNAGQSDLLNNIVAAAILAEQPTELRNDSSDPGVVEGSGV